MERPNSMVHHWSVIMKLLLYVLVPVAVVTIGVLGIAYLSDVSVTDLLRDANAVLEGEFYVGLFSTTGIALWAASGAMCLLVLSTRPPRAARGLLIAGGVVSLMLGADDAYLIHETIKNHVGISSYITITIYGIVGIVLFWQARHFLVTRPNVSVFVVAVFLLGISLLLDFAGEADLWTPPYSAVIEDVAKFLGIVSWVTFFGGVCRQLISQPAETLSGSRD